MTEQPQAGDRLVYHEMGRAFQVEVVAAWVEAELDEVGGIYEAYHLRLLPVGEWAELIMGTEPFEVSVSVTHGTWYGGAYCWSLDRGQFMAPEQAREILQG